MDDADASPVAIAVDGAVAVITMDDPARRNALGRVMLRGLIEAFAEAGRRQVRAIILRTTERNSVWCAGFDIRDLAPGHDPLAPSGPLQALFQAIQDSPAPVIALLQGTAWGGGADLALRCDIAIGDPRCTLAFTPARLGLPYDPDGLLNVLLRGGLNVAMEMFATGDALPAERALSAGLLNHLLPEAEAEPFAMAMARRIARNAPLSVASAKRQLRALNGALSLPAATMHRLIDERRATLDSADFIEGLAAFHAKRPPTFRGG